MLEKTLNKYQIGSANLFHIRNRNEVRVIEEIKSFLEASIHNLSDEVLSDVYALTLNSLPARYAQPHSLVLRDTVSKEEVQQTVAKSVEHILKNPKG